MAPLTMNAIIRRYLPIYLKGMAMGAADVVPGVAGGTVAFVTGIYDELLSSLRSIRPSTLKLLFTQGQPVLGRPLTVIFC